MNLKTEKTYIGTFGLGSSLANFYQPIKANDYENAHRIMREKHGREWAFIYTLDYYKVSQDDGYFVGHKPLDFIGGQAQ